MSGNHVPLKLLSELIACYHFFSVVICFNYFPMRMVQGMTKLTQSLNAKAEHKGIHFELPMRMVQGMTKLTQSQVQSCDKPRPLCWPP